MLWTEAKLSLGFPHSMERNSDYPPTNAHPTIFDDHGYLGREYMKLRADHRTYESVAARSVTQMLLLSESSRARGKIAE